MIRLFSVNVAVGFENAHLFEHVERLAYIDQLTQLPNRVAFNREIGRLTDVGEPFAVVIADIDNFQSVNDGLGHDIGDITLNLAGHLINPPPVWRQAFCCSGQFGQFRYSIAGKNL